MFFNWLFLFKKAYSIKPGLYFTNEEYDKNAPLIVTCNFLSTIILLYRRLKNTKTRILVIDTNGINVWCSSGKGKFSSQEILEKLHLYDKSILSDEEEIEIIIPKLSLSGVKLIELIKNKVKPIIGPIYAKNLKKYLNNPPYKDCVNDLVQFNFKARFYTVIPSMVQFLLYAVLMTLTTYIINTFFKTKFYWQIIPIVLTISFLYPILFPWLPGKRFSVKGISLAALLSFYVFYQFIDNTLSVYALIFYLTFIFGTCIFFALSYTGNSAVSNYSKVKKEIIRFLPICTLLYIISIIFYFITGNI